MKGSTYCQVSCLALFKHSFNIVSLRASKEMRESVTLWRQLLSLRPKWVSCEIYLKIDDYPFIILLSMFICQPNLRWPLSSSVTEGDIWCVVALWASTEKRHKRQTCSYTCAKATTDLDVNSLGGRGSEMDVFIVYVIQIYPHVTNLASMWSSLLMSAFVNLPDADSILRPNYFQAQP